MSANIPLTNSVKRSQLRFNQVPKFNCIKMQNNKNENNCFINVLIHSFSHFPLFQTMILTALNTNTFTNYALIQQLALILQQYKELTTNDNPHVLNPLNFRNELASYFNSKGMFGLHEKGDPTELLSFMLNCLHSIFFKPTDLNVDNSDKLCNSKCISHKLFYIGIEETQRCIQCQNYKQFLYDNNYFIYEIYVENVISVLIEEKAKYDVFKHKLILLYKILSEKELQYCATCKQHTMKRQLKCRALGDYLIFNCIYNDNSHLSMLYFLIGKYVELNEMFYNDNNNLDNKRYSLVGMTLYWGSHYVCVFYEKEINEYVIYDDTNLNHYKTWKDLVIYLVKNSYYPVLLFYQQVEPQQNECESEFDLSEALYSQLNAFENERNKNALKQYNDFMSNCTDNENAWPCEQCGNVNSYDIFQCTKCQSVNQIVYEFVKQNHMNNRFVLFAKCAEIFIFRKESKT